ncbi:SMP-30/gluconolactonase/LRE family protein [Oceanomicrobium pacificus]|uniref:SMP-30/gluconolactonase/LRE family protein n=1 Tax=Oceanomicrobium pacificus TaxID=2692916 RepID=A0A6B0TME3_9RHOB|nr:SMP-30/gluconolactonase/LRE family protein [Oceanomicrobium pacificus]MXU65730.1 SMP-30/gluconolactonase/LRE family protein [Oceanomicrobium pacificus]
MLELECIAPTGDICGEAATFSAEENCIYWTDINRFLLHRMPLDTRAVTSHIFDEPVVALSLTDRPGWLLVALGSTLILFNPATAAREDLGVTLDGWPDVRFNDGRSDPLGNFWVGTMGNNVGRDGEAKEFAQDRGTLYRYRAGQNLEPFDDGIGISNTFCWAPDGQTFYFGDTLANEIRAYPFDPETGDIGDRQPHFSGFDRGLPDGSAIDAEGYIWNCRYFGGCIVRVSPDGGIDRVIDMPVRNITTCCFGGPDLSTLFITTASAEKNPTDRLAGSLFALRTDTRGLPENRFRTG